MKKTAVLTIASLIVLSSASAQAQWMRTPTPNDTLQSVRILPNGNTVFSIYAPKARTVSLSGDIMSREAKTVEKNGVWSIEVPGVKPGAYRYTFVVDGVNVIDPKSDLAQNNRPVAMVEPDGAEFFSYNPDIPHGAMAIRKYQSSVLGTTRTMRVGTPAGYEKSKAKLPVLYLIHGGGDTDASWPSAGCAGDILDNLLAAGKMVPMIVVMPNGACDVSAFEKDLMNCVIPFIESNYRVLTDKDHRAVSGLSMGGIETLEVIFSNPDKFGYVWCLSGGFTPGSPIEDEVKRLNVIENIPIVNKNCKEFVMTQGGKTDITYISGERANKVFDENGLKYEYMEVGEGHTWYTWRLNLYDMAQRLFKK